MTDPYTNRGYIYGSNPNYPLEREPRISRWISWPIGAIATWLPILTIYYLWR